MAFTKEAVMATARDIKFGNYCDRIYHDLSGMKATLTEYVEEINSMAGPEKEVLAPHVPHYQDIIRMIDWKLEILTKVCPFEWAGFKGVETAPTVELDSPAKEREFSPGYLGG